MPATGSEALASEEAKSVGSKPAESSLLRLNGWKLFGLPQKAKLRRQKRRNRSKRDLPSLVCSG